MTRWAYLMGPWRDSGRPTRELPEPRNRTVSIRLAENSEVSCEIDGHSKAAADIVALSTDLYVYRQSPITGTMERLFRGRIGNTSDRLDDSGHVVNLAALDYRAVLSRRHLMTGSQITYDNLDQTAMAFALINAAQNATGGGGSYGITNAAPASGVIKSRRFELGDNIGDKIKELAQAVDGFDWDIVAVDDTLTFQTWYPQRGADRGVILEYPSAVTTVTRDVDTSQFANALRMTGQAPENSTTDPPPHEAYAPDIATTPAGRWDRVDGTDLTTAAALKDRIDWSIIDSGVTRPSYQVTLAPEFWQGPHHIWVGDTVRLVIFSGRLAIDRVPLRVQNVDITVDDQDNEAVTLGLGYPPPDYKRVVTDIERRLAALERR